MKARQCPVKAVPCSFAFRLAAWSSSTLHRLWSLGLGGEERMGERTGMDPLLPTYVNFGKDTAAADPHKTRSIWSYYSTKQRILLAGVLNVGSLQVEVALQEAQKTITVPLCRLNAEWQRRIGECDGATTKNVYGAHARGLSSLVVVVVVFFQNQHSIILSWSAMGMIGRRLRIMHSYFPANDMALSRCYSAARLTARFHAFIRSGFMGCCIVRQTGEA